MNDENENSPGPEAKGCAVLALGQVSFTVASDNVQRQGSVPSAESMTAGLENDVTDERSIIARVVAGERDEFRHLVIMYQDRVYSLLARQTGDAAVAHDLCQEVFIKAYKSLGKFRAEAKFSTWLVRIALNTMNSYFASRTYLVKKRSAEFDESLMESTDQTAESAQREREHFHLRKFVAELPQKYRDVVVLCSMEQKTYEETAAILDIAPGTVGSRLNKAYSLLRKQYQRAGYEIV